MNKKLANDARFPKTLALIFDEPGMLSEGFPADAMQEWESIETLQKLQETWESLGLTVVRLPLNHLFLSRYSKLLSDVDIIHSVVEGWGSSDRECWVTSLAELTGVPVIGASSLGHCVSMDKSLCLSVARDLQIPVANSVLIQSMESWFSAKSVTFKAKQELDFSKTYFVKPNFEGSGIGIGCSSKIELRLPQSDSIIRDLLCTYPEGILLEEYLPGKEYTSALIGGPKKRQLPVAEIIVEGGIYGQLQKSKTEFGEKLLFDCLSNDELILMEEWSRKLCDRLSIHDFVRLDWKKDSNGQLNFLEANTLPGLSYYYSVLPKMASYGGVSYESLLGELLSSAWLRRDSRVYRYGQKWREESQDSDMQ